MSCIYLYKRPISLIQFILFCKSYCATSNFHWIPDIICNGWCYPQTGNQNFVYYIVLRIVLGASLLQQKLFKQSYSYQEVSAVNAELLIWISESVLTPCSTIKLYQLTGNEYKNFLLEERMWLYCLGHPLRNVTREKKIKSGIK